MSDAQSELAALREELASAKRVLKDVVGDTSSDLRLRLTAAEQRNATLEKILDELLAQPTESGASEEQCCDRFPRCVCHEGADGL